MSSTSELDDVGETLYRPGRRGKSSSSKYDFIKVRVWLRDHYYVMSRFLVSRVLTVTQVKYKDAVRIALDLKKQLVDHALEKLSADAKRATMPPGHVDVTQADLEAQLFSLMSDKGYGVQYVSRFRMMTAFHHRRTPLVLLLSGTDCVGKSTIATLLAERLNLPNVLQTHTVHELTRSVQGLPITSLCAQRHADEAAFLAAYARECADVRAGVDADIRKALTEGKSIIIEGFHLDPALYADLFAESAFVLSFVLHLDDENTHRALVYDSGPITSDVGGVPPCSVEERLANYRTVQTHLVRQAAGHARVQLVAVQPRLFDVVDVLHSKVLQCIEAHFDMDG